MEIDSELGEINFTAGMPKADETPKPPIGTSDPKTSKAPAKGRGVGRPSNDSKLTDVRAELAQIVKFATMPLRFRDIHEDGTTCADLFTEFDVKKNATTLTPQANQFVDALAPVVFESPFLMKIITGGEALGKWGGLAFATYPLVAGIYSQHGGRNANHEIIDESPVE